MAIEDFFNHTCDLYHEVESGKSPGFGLPGAPSFDYPEEPDVSGVPCHFTIRSYEPSFTDRKPYTDVAGNDKVALPFGTDIRLNDKVVDLVTGTVYTAGVPRNIQSHHVIARLYRMEGQRAL